MTTKTLTQKLTSIILTLAFMMCSSFALFSADVVFDSYSSKSNGRYVYTKSPLGCNYSESWKKTICGSGNKWAMETTVNSYSLNNGELQINGTSVLTNNNVLYGFTGGTFVIAKDISGNAICVVAAKSNFIVSAASASGDDAETHGWGINPGTYKIKNWKIYVSPKTRTCNWYASIPSYVMVLNPSIEIIQCHTPTSRALTKLNEFLQYALSFAVSNGANITQLITKANNKTLTFSDVTTFINNVIDWAETQSLITSTQATAAGNIVEAIEGMEASGIIGLLPENYMTLVKLAYAIQTAVNDGDQGLTAATQILSYLKTLNESQSAFVPSSMEYVETILVNLKVLVQDKLTEKQLNALNKAIALVAAMNNLPDDAICGNLDIAFDAVIAVINLGQQGTITTETVKNTIDPLLDRVATAITTKYGATSSEMTYFNAIRKIYDNSFIIIANGGNGWTSDNLTTLIDGFSILSAAISNKDLSITTLQEFYTGIMAIVNNNGGWSFQNAEAIAGIINALQTFVQYPLLAQLEAQLIALKQ